MIAESAFYDQIPQILYASSVVIIAIAALALVWRRGFGSAKVTFGPGSFEVLSRIEQKVDVVGDAVNHTAEGSPSLAARVIRIDEAFHLHTEWVRESLHILAATHDVELPDYPAERPPGTRTRSTDEPSATA